jgi:putative ABC transport system substrate-binding protein
MVGAATAWPVAANAQERMRRVGVLLGQAADDPESLARNAAFLQGLQEAGWSVGRNVQIEYRWAAGDSVRARRFAAELVALKPDVIMAAGNAMIAALREATDTLPIVFAGVADPIGAGFVASLARPGGNITGFAPFEFGIAGKWLELLKEIAPGVKRVGVMRDAAQVSGGGQWGAIQAVAPSLGVDVVPIGLRNADEIEHGIGTFARQPNGGLIVTGGLPQITHQKLIIRLAARHQLPAVYYYRFFVSAAGLVSYGPDPYDQYRRAATYVDRILKGEKPADLPVQAPTKYELVINLRTAKALGLAVPPALLARADEVIE